MEVSATTSRRRQKDALRHGYLLPLPRRSLNMAAVKRADTKPEIALRKALHAAGYRFRKDYAIRTSDKVIRPDIVFTKRRLAVFVDGCFWHSCPRHGQIPATNSPFWRKKLSETVKRDRLQDQLLRESGWHVLRIWEHEAVQAAADLVIVAFSGAN